MDAKRPYHHGDLRAALLVAGEAVLAETGVGAFSLRQVAKRVGVSHSAPAHHFGDAAGLLAALAAEGFRRLLAAMRARQEGVAEPAARLVAAGLGYFDFARGSPALFRLAFTSERPEAATPELAEAGRAAFMHLVDGVAELRGVRPEADPAAMQDVLAAWSTVHGFAELFIAGRLRAVQAMPEAAREALLAGILERALVRGAPGATAPRRGRA